ncbi:hypothetical protein D9756_003576 [Leucocoprinus leucothites]|uniref:Nephrocystin 3-like N-terminal domain-containing protein n=1 Tax=Leucocoprinus leucothites TaxID=201217 RepID=A0A8H5LJW7_9AGAR|nr:hypothetical protein D9756_011459 [Leucoagaricus leucothites]KAF5359844.1 hypothetical protein D9756_003576 [Leucoagaricus leucothites]
MRPDDTSGSPSGTMPQNVNITSGPLTGIFPNASGFRIESFTAYAIDQTTSLGNSTVLQYLSDRIKKCVPGAMLDSADREYPPRCNPDTRRRLRDRIVTWGTVENLGRDWGMLWLSGSAGVGKSAVAQTVAEEFQTRGRLGAAFFFSRPNHLDDPDTVIPTLVYQLAVNHSQYKQILIRRLTDDPLILDKSRKTQFRELIVVPFHILATQHEDTVREPLLIVIDGLDECCDRAAQRELVELIGRLARQVPKLPLIWMICSRPESHLKAVFSDPDHPITCHRESLVIEDREAESDSWRILRSGFADIRRHYMDQLDPEWPRYIDLEKIATIASGHLGFVSFVLRFIGDEQYSDPTGQLRVCIRFLKRLPESQGPVNPLHALDLLYYQILSNVPDRDLPTTMRIVGMLILYPTQHDLPAQNHANFLELDQAAFYRSLQHLHSVLDIPLAQKASSEPIRVYHASFSDFLRDPSRSGRFCLDKGLIHLDVATKSLRWQNHMILAARGCTRTYPKLKWVRRQDDWDSVLHSLDKYSAEVGWNACCSVRQESVPTLINQFETFEFSGLQKAPEDFGTFLLWLYRLGPLSDSLIRIREAAPGLIDAGLTPIVGVPTLSLEHDVPDVAGYLHEFGFQDEDLSSSTPRILNVELGSDPRTLYVTLLLHQAISWTPYSPARSLTTPSTSFASLKLYRSITEPCPPLQMNNAEEQIGPSIFRQDPILRSDKEPPISLFTSESPSGRLDPLPLMKNDVDAPLVDSPQPIRVPLPFDEF